MKKATIVTILTISALSFGLGSFLVTEKATAQAVSCVALRNSLRVGSSDAGTNVEVTKLQKFLQSKGYMTISPTGYFGTVTSKAVKSFQSNENIPALGIVGPATRARIYAITCVPVVNEQPVVTPPSPTPIPPAETPVTTKTFKLPYTSSDLTDWTGVWGKSSKTPENNLELRASENTTGSQVLLSNSKELTDYVLNANIFVKQGTITLLSRYVDENNFLACTFSGRYIEIIEKVNGQSRVVAYATIPEAPYSSYYYNDLNIGMRVNKNSVGCSLIGSEDNVTFSNVNSALLKGGVGAQVWISTPGVAVAELRSVRISAI